MVVIKTLPAIFMGRDAVVHSRLLAMVDNRQVPDHLI